MKRIFIIFSLFIIVINSFGQEGQYDYLKVKKELKYKGVAFENWINDSTPGSVITGSNGLSKDGNNIELGGSELTKDVIIEGAGYGISFGTSINKAGNISNYVNGDYRINADGDVVINSNGQEWIFNGTWFYNEVTGDSLITFDEVRSLISSSALKIPTNFKYNFDATITDSRPGPGYFRFNNATYSLADEIYVDYYDDDNVDKSDFLTLADTGAHISVITGPNSYANYIISGGVINSSSYVKFEVTYLNNSGVISGLSTISLDLGGTGGGSGTTDSLYHADTQVWLQSGDTIPKADSVRVTYTADTIKTPLITTTGSLTLTNSTNSVSFTNDTIFAEEEAIKTKYVGAEKVNSDTVETRYLVFKEYEAYMDSSGYYMSNNNNLVRLFTDVYTSATISRNFGGTNSEFNLSSNAVELRCEESAYGSLVNTESNFLILDHSVDINNRSQIKIGNLTDQEITLSVANSAVSNSLLIEDNYFSFLYGGVEYARIDTNTITAKIFDAEKVVTDTLIYGADTATGFQDFQTSIEETVFNKLTSDTVIMGADTTIGFINAQTEIESIEFEKIQFDTASQAYSEGTVYYDKRKKALTGYNDIAGFSHNYGYEVVRRVYNNTGATIPNERFVRRTGTHANDARVATIALAGISTKDSTNVWGITTVEIPPSSYGIVTYFGDVEFSNNSTLSEDAFYCGFAGVPIDTSPPPPYYSIYGGEVLYADNDSGIYSVSIEQATYDPSPKYSSDISSLNSVVTVTTQNVYYYIPIGSAVEFDNHGFTVAGDSIQFKVAGDYQIVASMSFQGNPTSETWNYGWFINGVLQHKKTRTTNTSSAGDANVPLERVFAKDDWLSFKIRNTSGTGDPTIVDLAIQILFLSE